MSAGQAEPDSSAPGDGQAAPLEPSAEDRAAAAEARVADLERHIVLDGVAREAGLDPDLVELVTGSTRDEQVASARTLAARYQRPTRIDWGHGPRQAVAPPPPDAGTILGGLVRAVHAGSRT